MTSTQFKKIVINTLKNKPPKIPKFCEICGRYSSKKHQGMWCSKCPGKMKEYSDMTWADCLLKAKPYGSGWMSSFQFYTGGFSLEGWLGLWRSIGGSKQIYKWCEQLGDKNEI